MPLTMGSIPVTNTLAWPITLYNGAPAGPGLLTLAAGASTVLNLTFDRIRVITPVLPHNVYVENPIAAVVVNPGNLGYFRTGPAVGLPGAIHQTYVLSVGAPNQNATTYTFA